MPYLMAAVCTNFPRSRWAERVSWSFLREQIAIKFDAVKRYFFRRCQSRDIVWSLVIRSYSRAWSKDTAREMKCSSSFSARAGTPNLVSQNLALDVQSFQSFFHLFAAADRRGQTPVEPTQILSQLDELFTWPNPQKSKLGVKLFK